MNLLTKAQHRVNLKAMTLRALMAAGALLFGACAQPAFDAALVRAEKELSWLREQHKSKSLELLGVPTRTDDLAAAQAVVDAYCKDTSDVAVLGIGGSSLGGQALKAL